MLSAKPAAFGVALLKLFDSLVVFIKFAEGIVASV